MGHAIFEETKFDYWRAHPITVKKNKRNLYGDNPGVHRHSWGGWLMENGAQGSLRDVKDADNSANLAIMEAYPELARTFEWYPEGDDNEINALLFYNKTGGIVAQNLAIAVRSMLGGNNDCCCK